MEFQLQYQLISFRISWFDLLAVQETLKSLLQHHSSRYPPLIVFCLLLPGDSAGLSVCVSGAHSQLHVCPGIQVTFMWLHVSRQ